ncbi:MAG: hypothetical protein ACR2N5_05950 [Solirubrobacterales bacterium]
MADDGEASGSGGIVARSAARGRRLAVSSRAWLARRRAVSTPINLIVSVYERDHENFGSVLGSAVAFRLFLFMLSLVALALGIGTLLIGAGWFDGGLSDEIGVAGALAAEIDKATEASETTGWILAFVGLTGTLWAGRNVAITQVAASARAWNIPRRGSRTTVRMVGGIIGVAVVLSVASFVVNALRGSGPAAVTTSFLAVFVVFAAVWFAFTLTLPRATRDPTVLLPGAVLVGATFAALQLVSQFYLGPQLESQTALFGGLGVAAVVLGWLFVGSRIMVASYAVNAVFFEQLGSALHMLFELPGLRRLPSRYAWLSRLLEGEEQPMPGADDVGELRAGPDG